VQQPQLVEGEEHHEGQREAAGHHGSGRGLPRGKQVRQVDDGVLHARAAECDEADGRHEEGEALQRRDGEQCAGMKFVLRLGFRSLRLGGRKYEDEEAKRETKRRGKKIWRDLIHLVQDSQNR
jgi:hypothetical protein